MNESVYSHTLAPLTFFLGKKVETRVLRKYVDSHDAQLEKAGLSWPSRKGARRTILVI